MQESLTKRRKHSYLGISEYYPASMSIKLANSCTLPSYARPANGLCSWINEGFVSGGQRWAQGLSLILDPCKHDDESEKGLVAFLISHIFQAVLNRHSELCKL